MVTSLVQGTIFLSAEMTKIVAFAFLLVLVTTMWIPSQSYATLQSEQVRWQLIFLSPYGGCTNYQYQMANQYDEITTKYFDLYQFDNSKYPPQCMPDKKYTNYQPPKDLDLLILVYDNEIGKRELRANDIGGLYNHVGTDITKNHTIIICDCSNFGFSDPTWILSHELSHFITNYLGFDLTVVENNIHSVDSKYVQCTNGQRNDTCSKIITDIYGDQYFGRAVVMTPYQPAVGKKLFEFENQTTSNTTSSNLTNSQIVINMQKGITKWWLEGKISDVEYTTMLQYATGRSDEMIKNDKLLTNVILEDGPNGKEQKPLFYDPTSNQTSKENSLLKRVPFKQDNVTDLSVKNEPIPQWFKSRAYWWSQDQFTSDNDFLNGVKYLLSTQTSK